MSLARQTVAKIPRLIAAMPSWWDPNVGTVGKVFEVTTSSPEGNIMKLFKLFAKDEDGAVTVDWVVLTSAIVGLGIAVMLSVGNSTSGLADKISDKIQSTDVWTY